MAQIVSTLATGMSMVIQLVVTCVCKATFPVIACIMPLSVLAADAHLSLVGRLPLQQLLLESVQHLADSHLWSSFVKYFQK